MIGKIQNVNTSFGKIHIEKAKKTTVPLNILCSDKDVKKTLTESLREIGNASGEHVINFWAREYDNYTKASFYLTSAHWQKTLPRFTITKDMTTEEKIEEIKNFKEKAINRIGATGDISVNNISDLLEEFS